MSRVLSYENRKCVLTLILIPIFSLLFVPHGIGGQGQENGDHHDNIGLAKKLLLEARELVHPVDLDTLIEIGKLQAKAGDLDGTTSTFGQILRQIQTLPRLEANSPPGKLYLQRARHVYFLMLAETQYEIGKKDFAEKILDLAQRAIETIQRPYDRLQAFHRFFLTQIRLNFPSNPSVLLSLIPNEDPRLGDLTYQKVKVLLSIANAYHKVGNDRAATRLLKKAHSKIEAIEKNSYRNELLIQLASGLIKTGHPSKGEQILRREFHRSDSLGMESSEAIVEQNIYSLIEMAKAFHHVGNVLQARARLSQALEVLHSFSNSKEYRKKSMFLRNIALAKVEMGNLEEALAIDEEILDEDYKGQSWAPVAEKMIDRGELLQALNLAERIGKRDRPRMGYILSQIGVAYAKSGNIQEALNLTSRLGFPFTASIYFAVASQMVKEKPFNEVIVWANKTEYPYYRIYALIGMANGLLNKI